MTTIAAAEDLMGSDPAAIAQLKIKQLVAWPPAVTWAFGHSLVVEPIDTLIAAECMPPADDTVAMRLCKADGQEYGVELALPPSAVAGVLEALRPGMTLAAIGELMVGSAAARPPEALPVGAA